MEGSSVRNGAKLSGWMADSQESRKLRLYTGFLRLLVASEVSEGEV